MMLPSQLIQGGYRQHVFSRADDGTAPPDTSSRSGSIIACAVSCWMISGFAVAARFYTRARIQRVLGPEDWCVFAAYLLALGFTVATIYGCKYGNGSHIWNIAPGDFSLYLRTGWVGTLFYQLSLAMSKVSILLLYIRLFQFNWASRVAWVILAIVVAYNVGGFISAMTLCRPLEAFWDSTIEGECKSASYTWAVIGLHVATDFLIFLLPIPVVWLMTSLSWREKIGVMLIFAIGFFVCIISILRIIWIKEALANDSQDPLYDYATLSYWNCVEVNSAIIIPCLVVMRPLFRKILKSSAAHSHEPLDGLEDQESLELAPPVQARRRIGSLVRSRSSERTDDAMETGGTDVRLPDAVDEPKAPPNAFRGFRFDK